MNWVSLQMPLALTMNIGIYLSVPPIYYKVHISNFSIGFEEIVPLVDSSFRNSLLATSATSDHF